jgi:hypothetical protein
LLDASRGSPAETPHYGGRVHHFKKLGKGITYEATRAFAIADEVENLPKTPEL